MLQRKLGKARLLVLLGLPVVIFVLPALFGLPITPGDDRTQNYPLRLLVGQIIRSGHLPLYTPDLWSGAPLLSGWNAGAAYPLTWLFVFLPPDFAWGLNQCLSAWVAELSMAAFVFELGGGPAGAFAAALTFQFTGAMIAQTVHFPLVSGASWIPLAALAVYKLSRLRFARENLAALCGWSAALGISVALNVLSGEPRAVDIAAAILVPYALWCAFLNGYPGSLLSIGAGALLGLLTSGIQTLPGLAMVYDSQRSFTGYTFFTAGSLPLRWTSLLLIPTILGGSGSFELPRFFASYSLDEVTGYVGLMAWVGAVQLPFLMKGRESFRLYGIWYLIAALGIVLAVGGYLPTGHVLYHIPLVGSQRLQSRNIMVTDFALSVLLGLWLDRAWEARRTKPVVYLAGAIPLLVTAGFGVCDLLIPYKLVKALGVDDYHLAVDNRPAVGAYLGLALAGLVVLFLLWRSGGRLAKRLLYLFLLVDGVWFALSTVVELWPASIPPPPTQAATLHSTTVVPVESLGIPGRFVIYDPQVLYSQALADLDPPDQNAVLHFPSIQGYGSLVEKVYAAQTGVHADQDQGQDVISPTALGNGVLDQLDPGAFLTPPDYLVSPVYPRVPPLGYGDVELSGAGEGFWFFGNDLYVTEAGIYIQPADGRVIRLTLSAYLYTIDHALRPLASKTVTTRGGSVHFRAALSEEGVALVIKAKETGASAPRDFYLRRPWVMTDRGAAYYLDGILQPDVKPSQWSFVGRDGPFSLFRAVHPEPLVRLKSLSKEKSTSSYRVLSAYQDGLPKKVEVNARQPLLLIRSANDLPGSFATIKSVKGGPQRRAVLIRYGLVQAVKVPAGQWVVSFGYDPPRFLQGALLTLFGLLSIIGLTLGAYLFRRERGASQLGELKEERRVPEEVLNPAAR